MINWSEASPVLVDLFSRLAFDSLTPEFRARWGGRSQTVTHMGAKTDVLLRVRRIDPVGEDETRYCEEPSDPQDPDSEPILVPYQVGNRRLTLEVRVEALENTDELWAWSTVERMRTRLSRPSSLAILESVNMALIRTQGATPLPMVRDRHEKSVAVMEVVLGARFSDRDAPINWIERIELSSKVQDADGSLLPTPPNVADAVIPPLPPSPPEEEGEEPDPEPEP